MDALSCLGQDCPAGGVGVGVLESTLLLLAALALWHKFSLMRKHLSQHATFWEFS